MDTNQDVKFVKTKHEFVNELPFREGQLIFVEDMDIVLKDKDDGSRRVISGTPKLRTVEPSEDRGTGAEYEVDIGWINSIDDLYDGDSFSLIFHKVNTTWDSCVDVMNGKTHITTLTIFKSSYGAYGPQQSIAPGDIQEDFPLLLTIDKIDASNRCLWTDAAQFIDPKSIVAGKDKYIVGGEDDFGITKTPEEVREHIGAQQKFTGEQISVVAKDKIQIGNVVYTVEGGWNTIEQAGEFNAYEDNEPLNGDVSSAIFSPDGRTLIIIGDFAGFAKVYSVDGTNVTFVSNIYADANESTLNGRVTSAILSPNGQILVLVGDFTGYAKVYSVNGTTVSFASNISADESGTTPLNAKVNMAAFSPIGNILVLVGYFSGLAKVYSITGTSVTFVSNISADANGTEFNRIVSSAFFSADGSILLLGWISGDRVKAYSVSGTNITFIGSIPADANGAALSDSIDLAVFSPNCRIMILSGYYGKQTKAYSIKDGTITFLCDVFADAVGTSFDGTVKFILFSPDSQSVVLCGGFGAKIYSVNSSSITYSGDICDKNASVNSAYFFPDGKSLILGDGSGYAYLYLIDGTSSSLSNKVILGLGSRVSLIAFNPTNRVLVFGGTFSERAKVYSLDGVVIDFVDNIYANSKATQIMKNINTATFSPDGKALVLGGDFPGYAKTYSVEKNRIVHTGDLYADSKRCFLDGAVHTATFSPNGSILILGGSFSGGAKMYIAAGSSITYLKDIYLPGDVKTATFSPDGTTLVLGGSFSGYARAYSVSGPSITGNIDIYADSNDTALNGDVNTAAFSPDGGTLVLGGSFSGYAKVYSVNGASISYLSDIYDDSRANALNGPVNAASFSPDGSILAIGGSFSGYAKVYAVIGQTVYFHKNVLAGPTSSSLNGIVRAISFSQDDSTLAICGDFTNYAKLYSTHSRRVINTSKCNAVGIVAVCGVGVTNNVHTLTSYQEAAEIFVRQNHILSFIKAIFENGAGKVYAIPILSEKGYDAGYRKLEEIEDIKAIVCDVYVDATQVTMRESAERCAKKGLERVVVLGGTDEDGTVELLNRASRHRGEQVIVIGRGGPEAAAALAGAIAARGGSNEPIGNITLVGLDTMNQNFNQSDMELLLAGGVTPLIEINGTHRIINAVNTSDLLSYQNDLHAGNESIALNGSVSSLAFSPTNSALICAGAFSDKARFYTCSTVAIPSIDTELAAPCQIGISCSNMEPGDIGTAIVYANANPMAPSVYDPQGKRQDVYAYADSAKAKTETVTLPSDGWADNTQTVAVTGVLADTAKQAITPAPTPESWEAAGKAMVRCTAQGADSLTFVCKTVPAVDLTYHVVIQEVRV